MADAMISAFESSLDKTNLILKDIEPPTAGRRTGATSRTRRCARCCTCCGTGCRCNESAEFAQQLPVLVRGIYFDGWQPADVPIKLNRDDFLYEVRQGFPYDAEGGPERVTQVVLDTLRRHVTQGEWQDVKASMPKDLATLMP